MNKVKRFALGVILLSTSASFAFAQSALTLGQCVQIALEKNSTYINAKHRETIAETNVTITRANILPQINSSFQSARFQQGTSTFQQDVPVIDPSTGQVLRYEQQSIVREGSNRQSHSMSVSLTQTIFDFGQSFDNIKQAKASRKSSRYVSENTKQTTILTVYQSFYQLLQNIQLVEVQKEAVKSSDEQLKKTQAMYEIGSVAQVDLYRSQTTLGNDRIFLIRAENNVLDARGRLNVAMGRSPDARLEIIEDAEQTASAPQYTINQALETALQQNPQIFRFKADMSAARHGSRSAKKSYLPSFAGSASYTRSNTEFTPVYSNFDNNWSVNLGARINFNLFNGFSDLARIDREETNYEIAEENLVNTERDLRRQVQEALFDLEMNRQIQEINNQNIKSAEEDHRLQQERFRVGAGTSLDVIAARASLTSARSTFVRAKYDTKIAEAQLQAAMGTLK